MEDNNEIKCLIKNKRKKGLTLIELLLALSLMIVILGVIFTFFQFNSRSINESQIKSDLQADGRAVIESLTNNIMEAKAIDKLEFISPADKTIKTLGLKLIKLSDGEAERVEFNFDNNELKLNSTKSLSKKIKYIKITNIDASKDFKKQSTLDELNKTTNILNIEIMVEDKKIPYTLKNQIVLRNFDSGEKK